MSTIEMATSLEDAAETAASLVFDRIDVRRAVAPVGEDRGIFIAWGARRDGDDSAEVRFYLHRR